MIIKEYQKLVPMTSENNKKLINTKNWL